MSQSTYRLVQSDGVTLETRIYNATPPSTRLAFVAHPFGKLGGSWNDPVVKLITSTLLDNGWNVVNYNARGVGKSTGSGSFSFVLSSLGYLKLIIV